jgi:hypothetical protein
MNTKATITEAIECIENNEMNGRIADSSIPAALRSAVEEILGTGWSTINGGEIAYLDVDRDSIEIAKKECSI